MSDNARKFWHRLIRVGFARNKIAAIGEKTAAMHADFFYESSTKDLLKIMMLEKVNGE